MPIYSFKIIVVKSISPGGKEGYRHLGLIGIWWLFENRKSSGKVPTKPGGKTQREWSEEKKETGKLGI